MGMVIVGNPSTDQSQVTRQVWTDEIDNLSTTAVKKSLGLGRSWVEVNYHQGSGSAATSKLLYVVINAISDNDAAVRLATVGAGRIEVPLGGSQKVFLPSSGLATRIDFAADVAETGSTKTTILSGV